MSLHLVQLLALVVLRLAPVASSKQDQKSSCSASLLDEHGDRLKSYVFRQAATHVLFTCNGTQQANFEVDGVALTRHNMDSRFAQIGDYLLISHLKRTDSGCYRCSKRSNDSRCFSDEVCLTVIIDYPHIFVDKSEYHVSSGSSLRILANVSNLKDCGSNLAIHWSWNERKLENGTTALMERRGSWLSLTLSKVYLKRNGTVHLLVGNEIGYDRLISLKLIVTGNLDGKGGGLVGSTDESQNSNSVTPSQETASESLHSVHVSAEYPAVLVASANATDTGGFPIIVVATVPAVGAVLILLIVLVFVVRRHRRRRLSKQAVENLETRKKEPEESSSKRLENRSSESVESLKLFEGCLDHSEQSSVGGSVQETHSSQL